MRFKFNTLLVSPRWHCVSFRFVSLCCVVLPLQERAIAGGARAEGRAHHAAGKEYDGEFRVKYQQGDEKRKKKRRAAAVVDRQAAMGGDLQGHACTGTVDTNNPVCFRIIWRSDMV